MGWIRVNQDTQGFETLGMIPFYKDVKDYVGRNDFKDKKQPPLLANKG